MALNCSSQYYGNFHSCSSKHLHTKFTAVSIRSHSQSNGNRNLNCNLNPPLTKRPSFRSIRNCISESDELVNPSSNGKVRLLPLKLPATFDVDIKSQVLKSHNRDRHSPLLRQPLLFSIKHILVPATHFVDSIILDKKVLDVELSNLDEFNSSLSKLKELRDLGQLRASTLMDQTAMKAVQLFDEINVQTVSMDILGFLSKSSWDEKATNVMGCFVLKFVEFLAFLLHGPNQSFVDLASSMTALKENPVSIVGSPLENSQQPIDQLNNLTMITLELIQYVCELVLLSDTKYEQESLVSTAVYWVILSALVGYIQITLIMDNGEVALDLHNLISNLSCVLDKVKHRFTICKPQIEEMEAHMQFNALFEDIFDSEKISSDNPSKISEFMKKFTYSKDSQQALIDGSTMSEVDLEVLNGKTVLLLISDLDMYSEKIELIQNIYKEIREEDCYKIVWVPFVLKWTKTLRKKFENLKSKTPWYTICYDSPISGLWYFKGRLFSGSNPLVLLIDLQNNVLTGKGQMNQDTRLCIEEKRVFPFKRLVIRKFLPRKQLSYRTVLSALHSKYAPVAIVETLEKPISQNEKQEVAGVHQKKPSTGFTGLLAMTKRGNEQGGSSDNVRFH